MLRRSVSTVLAASGLVLAACGSSTPAATARATSAATAGATRAATARVTVPSTTADPSSAARASTVAKADPPATPAATGQWLTFHGNNARTGVDASGAKFPHVHRDWSLTLDGQLYAEPLVWHGLVIAATEADLVYGIDAADGRIEWTRRIGTPVPLSDLPCGNIDPEGITATPAIDPSDGRLFVEGETRSPSGAVDHRLVALDASNGQVVFSESDVPAGMNSTDQQGRAALLVANGRVYAGYGGLWGDCGSYKGWVVSASTSGPGPLSAYHVHSQNQGAIWEPGGAAATSAGDILVGTGNASSETTYDDGNSVIELSPSLSVLQTWAPGTWAYDNTHDLDLGTTTPEPLSDGLIFEIGKEAKGYLLDAAHLGGINGQVYEAPVCYVQGGSDAVEGSNVYVPCTNGGLEDVQVSGSPTKASFRVAWTASVTGSPIMAGGYLWLMDGSYLYALKPSNGHIAQTVATFNTPDHFATPSAGDGELFAGVGDTLQAFSGT